MNFFHYQETAKKLTRYLVFLLIIAILILTGLAVLLCALIFGFDSPIIKFIAIFIPGFIIFFSLRKIKELSAGGQVIADSLKATRIKKNQTRSAKENQLINIVEEMAIASGINTPKVYILDKEMSINALAAGTKFNNMVIILTKGCLNILNRDELQAIVAHEFSHIVHCDTLISVRLIGLLHGLNVISYTGQFLIGKFPILGVSLLVSGFLGRFIASMIKFAICRQREFLADASAVKYTRYNQGLADVLKKIGGYKGYPYMLFTNITPLQHMLFSFGSNPIYEFLVFQTHPSLEARIRKLDQQWDGEFIYVAQSYSISTDDVYDDDKAAQLLGVFSCIYSSRLYQQNRQEMTRVEKLMLSLPEYWDNFARDPQKINSVIYSLFLDSQADYYHNQLEKIKQHDPKQLGNTQILIRTSPYLSQEHKLLLAELLGIREVSIEAEKLHTIHRTLSSVFSAKTDLTIFDWCLFTILFHPKSLNNNTDGSNINYLKITDIEKSCYFIYCALLKMQFVSQPNMANSIYNKLMEITPLSHPYRQYSDEINIKYLPKHIKQLNNVEPMEKPNFVQAILLIIKADGKIDIEEHALLKAICTVIDSPTPPLNH